MFEMHPLDWIMVITKAGKLFKYKGSRSSLVILSFFFSTNTYYVPIFQGSFEYKT